MLFNSSDIWCVKQKGLGNNERNLVRDSGDDIYVYPYVE